MSFGKRYRVLSFVFMGSTAITTLLVFMQYQSQFLKYEKASITSTNDFWRLHKHRNSLAHPQPWKIIDLKIQYLINNLVCSPKFKLSTPFDNSTSQNNEPIFMHILITSHAGDVKTRARIREILPLKELKRLNMRRLFLLAQIGSSSQNANSKYKSVTNQNLLEESIEFEDILMGDFQESYRNLTYKHLMGLEWATRYCSHATFILKQDDDIIVDFYQLSEILTERQFWNPLINDNYIFGKILDNQPIIRDPTSKWFVSENEMSGSIYPPFVSGWGYITTPKVAMEIVKVSKARKYFWIDDAFITGNLRETAQVKLLDMNEMFTVFKGQLQCCIATSRYSSKDNQPYWCDFVVGPSNDDLELMTIFQNHARFCHTTKTCLRRIRRQRLNFTCVVTNSMVVNNFVKNINKTPVGLWKHVRI